MERSIIIVHFGSQLEQRGHHFRTDHSDTEVLVNGYLEWGTDLFSRLDGMFAVGIWDNRKQSLILARDRFGIKPLYIASPREGGIVFASEPKAILGSKLIQPVFREKGLVEYFLSRSPRWPNSMISTITKIPPGHCEIFGLTNNGRTSKKFWCIQSEPVLDLTIADLETELDTHLSRAVESHLMSDVPLGIFLSGGIDSSLVATFASRSASLRAFTIGTDSKFDERAYASTVAHHLKFPINLREISPHEFIDKFDEWSHSNDDPSADPSALALMILAEYARENGMKVMLAGEGGDELFGGYNSYLRFHFFHLLSRIPLDWKRLKLLCPDGRNADYLQIIDKLHFLGTGHLTDYSNLKAILDLDLHPYIGELLETQIESSCNSRPMRSAMLVDENYRLPDDVLMRTDRATMYYALETRVPWLDNHVADFANKLPDRACFNPFTGGTKALSKSLALRHLPREVIYRPKRGFDIPIAEWLAGPFQPKIKDYLSEESIPGIRYTAIHRLLSTFRLSKSIFLAGQIWAWLIVEAWYRLYIRKEASPRTPESTLNPETYAKLAPGCADITVSESQHFDRATAINEKNSGYLAFVGDFLPQTAFRPLFEDNEHCLIGNLECAVTHNLSQTSKAYPLVVNPATLSISDFVGFSALSVANNHSYDAGARGFDNMLEILHDNLPEIQVYGSRENPFADLNINGVRCAIIGCQEFCASRGYRIFKQEHVKPLIQEISSGYHRVYVTPHWGKYSEFAFHPSPKQRKVARAWIDAGASGVFGCHTHTANAFEIIDDKPVFYSLGNFFFNHEESKSYPLTSYGLLVKSIPEYQNQRDVWDYSVTRFSDSKIELMNSLESKPLIDFIVSISDALSNNYVVWAEQVGSIYATKSLLSWRERTRSQSPYVVIPRLLLWNFIPINLLLLWKAAKNDHLLWHLARQIEKELSDLRPESRR